MRCEVSSLWQAVVPVEAPAKGLACRISVDEREAPEVCRVDQNDERKETMKTGDGRRKTKDGEWILEWLATLAGFLLGLLAAMKWL